MYFIAWILLVFFIEHHLLFLYLRGFLNAFSITISLLPTPLISVHLFYQHRFFPPALFQDTIQPECGRQASRRTCSHRVVCQQTPEQPIMVSAGLAAWLSLERLIVWSLDEKSQQRGKWMPQVSLSHFWTDSVKTSLMMVGWLLPIRIP